MTDHGEELRRKAEGRLPARPSGDHLRHELAVHQMELELQNEELRTARLETEEALARYIEIFDFAPIGYAVLSAETEILQINLAGARLLRSERARLVHARFDAKLSIPGRVALFRAVQQAVLGDGPASCDVGLPNDCGTLHVTATRLPHDGDRALVAFEDVTEQRAKAARLEASEAALREGQQRKDDFLSALSHELRNPLGPIRNSLFTISRTEANPEQTRGAYAIIERQVAHMARLVDDLLDVTRITRGKMQIKCTSLDLGELVERAVEDHRPGFVARAVVLASRVDPGLVASADPVRLTQVISNVLNNAEKFTPRGGHVTVEVRRDGTTAVLVVRDDGVGIAADVLPHLFQTFVQAPQTVERSFGGLGLGLATVKGIVELHGGSVAIRSEGPARGTEVTIRLPLEQAPWYTPPETKDVAAVPRRVLVIDDNVDGAESLKQALELIGHTACIAHSGYDGIRIARDFHPDVVVCDIGLPDIDGYGVAAAFRNDPELRTCYLVALTGYARPVDIENASRAGFDRHLAKPASMDQLADALADATRS